MLFGSNILIPVSGQTAYRLYFPEKQGVPTEKAIANLGVPGGMTPIISFRPPPAPVVAGALDESIRAFFKNLYIAYQAPVLVAAWHEANDPNQHQNPAAIKAMHQHLAGLASDEMHVFYGAIADTYPVQHYSQDLADWIPAGMDWVGLDGYKVVASDTIENVFATAQAQVDMLANRLLITETNVMTDRGTAIREQWLRNAAMYATEEEMEGLLVYYHHPGTTLPPAPGNALLAELSITAATAGILA